jgi:hypothetical protein
MMDDYFKVRSQGAQFMIILITYILLALFFGIVVVVITGGVPSTFDVGRTLVLVFVCAVSISLTERLFRLHYVYPRAVYRYLAAYPEHRVEGLLKADLAYGVDSPVYDILEQREFTYLRSLYKEYLLKEHERILGLLAKKRPGLDNEKIHKELTQLLAVKTWKKMGEQSSDTVETGGFRSQC